MAKKLISPKGEAVYPRLAGKPDTKFNDDGVWKTGLRLPLDEAKEFMTFLDGELKKSVEAANADPKNKGKKFKAGAKPYQIDEETNTVLVNFVMNATFKKDGEVKNMQPAVFGRDGKPIDPKVRIGGGSRIAVAYNVGYTIFQKNAYVKLWLNAVMIYDLVEFGGDAAGYGFEMEADDAADSDDEETDITEDGGADDEDATSADDF